MHLDNCLSEPIAVAALPPGAAGSRGQLGVDLPRLTGRHDLCFTFTSDRFDPILALDWVQLIPAGAGS